MTVLEFLRDYRNSKIYYPGLVDEHGIEMGNHGDRLMRLGENITFSKLNLTFVDNAANADLIIIGGGGYMHEKYSTGARLLRKLCRSWPDIPICFLPGTYYYPTTPFAHLANDDKDHSFTIDINGRQALITIFCREAYSYNHLLQEHKLPSCCEVHLDHDMAFHLADSNLVKEIASGTPRHVLIVERIDQEHINIGFNTMQINPVRRLANKVIPIWVKKPIYPLVKLYRAHSNTPFLQQCESMLARNFSDFMKLPKFVRDISAPNYGTFQSFCAAIQDAAVVFTTRAHVGILAAMAGKPTVLFEGPYHKIRGLYEHSLKNFSNVTFVSLLEKEINKCVINYSKFTG
jgi:exopolysaccharide biosynthesis predicted pyruvyltransferase EpsI